LLFGGGKAEQVLQYRDDANHSYAFSAAPRLPVVAPLQAVDTMARSSRRFGAKMPGVSTKMICAGTFAPLAVCKPLSAILHRTVKIDAFQQHLKKFITEERGNILVRRGHDRAFRFRFREPMMQPFVIMQGIEQGLVAPSAIDALSFPEQPNLPI
jgi:hypothetical protein